MASKIIKIKISKASAMQIQTFMLELIVIAKQWLRKVGVKIKMYIFMAICSVIYIAVIWQDLMMF